MDTIPICAPELRIWARELRALAVRAGDLPVQLEAHLELTADHLERAADLKERHNATT